MDCNNCVPVAEMGVKIDNLTVLIEKMDKTLHGNGRIGLVDEINQFKGGFRVAKIVLTSGILLSFITGIVGIFI